jgi:antibiotic biosynthesis monooxygenase (ABM) superfamily enzyme
MTPPRSKIVAFVLVLCLVSLACEPVFVVGWQEIAFILLLAVFLVGPLVYRLLRAWIRFQDSRKEKK